MSTPSDTAAGTTVQMYRVYIKATAEAVWEAITKPEWTERYGYGGLAEYELRAGGTFRQHADENMKAAGAQQGYQVPDLIIDGEVLECDPPRRLVQTWRMLMDPGMAAEGFTRLTYELQEIPGGATKLTVTHDLTGAPGLAMMVAGGAESEGAGGGWAWILSDLKTLLETGKRLAA